MDLIAQIVQMVHPRCSLFDSKGSSSSHFSEAHPVISNKIHEKYDIIQHIDMKQLSRILKFKLKFSKLILFCSLF